MVVRPKVRANESLQSYMTRICRANGWRYLGFKAYVTKYVAPLNSTKLNDRKAISTFLVNTFIDFSHADIVIAHALLTE